jgi:hypothetical protein
MPPIKTMRCASHSFPPTSQKVDHSKSKLFGRMEGKLPWHSQAPGLQLQIFLAIQRGPKMEMENEREGKEKLGGQQFMAITRR